MNAASPDAELIRMCTRFIQVETLMITTYDGPQCIEDDAERFEFEEPWQREARSLLGPVLATEAKTMDGIIARARLLATSASHILRDEQVNWDGMMVQALLRDLLALGRAA